VTRLSPDQLQHKRRPCRRKVLRYVRGSARPLMANYEPWNIGGEAHVCQSDTRRFGQLLDMRVASTLRFDEVDRRY
jgi:hypothetical protein